MLTEQRKRKLSTWILTVTYVLLLLVLLPHTAWMFSILEPTETKYLSYFIAISFEITVWILTHYFSKEVIVSMKLTGWKRLKQQFGNVPAILLLMVMFASVIANWTHGYIFFGSDLSSIHYDRTSDFFSYSAVRLMYSILFGGVLPICSFAYAYVLSMVNAKQYGYHDDNTEDSEFVVSDFQRAWLVLLELRNGDNQDLQFISPKMIADKASVDESIAMKALSEAISMSVPALPVEATSDVE